MELVADWNWFKHTHEVIEFLNKVGPDHVISVTQDQDNDWIVWYWEEKNDCTV